VVAVRDSIYEDGTPVVPPLGVCATYLTPMYAGQLVRRDGCGHALDDHTDGLKCRVCKRECGIDCRPHHERVVANLWPREIGSPADRPHEVDNQQRMGL
jgi:hypothetical protein